MSPCFGTSCPLRELCQLLLGRNKRPVQYTCGNFITVNVKNLTYGKSEKRFETVIVDYHSGGGGTSDCFVGFGCRKFLMKQ